MILSLDLFLVFFFNYMDNVDVKECIYLMFYKCGVLIVYLIKIKVW